MALLDRLSNPWFAAGAIGLVILSLIGLFFVGVEGEIGARTSGGGAGVNAERHVVGMKIDVPAGAVMHLDPGARGTFRCGTNDEAVVSCIYGRSVGTHPADATASFYVTEGGDAWRILNGLEPRHVLYRGTLQQALRGEIELVRPAGNGEVMDGNVYDFRWRPGEPSAETVEIFWVLENRSGAHFLAAENHTDTGRPLDPVFQFHSSDQVRLTTRWHDPAHSALLFLLVASAVLGGVNVAAWAHRTMRKPNIMASGSAEAHLDVLHGELVTLARMMDSIVLGGGLLLAVGIGATVATWIMADPTTLRPGEHQWSNDFEGVLRLTLASITVVAAAIWATATADIRRRYRALSVHLQHQPELL